MRYSARPSLEGGRTRGRRKSREKRCALLVRNCQTSLFIVGDGSGNEIAICSGITSQLSSSLER